VNGMAVNATSFNGLPPLVILSYMDLSFSYGVTHM
jgi:hypothetical protein